MLKYFYYKYYRWSEAVNKGELHHINAAIMLSFTVLVNIFSIFLILANLLEVISATDLRGVKYEIAALSTVFSILVTRYFCTDNKYQEIVDRYKYEKQSRKWVGSAFVATYTVLSPVILILLGFFFVYR